MLDTQYFSNGQRMRTVCIAIVLATCTDRTPTRLEMPREYHGIPFYDPIHVQPLGVLMHVPRVLDGTMRILVVASHGDHEDPALATGFVVAGHPGVIVTAQHTLMIHGELQTPTRIRTCPAKHLRFDAGWTWSDGCAVLEIHDMGNARDNRYEDWMTLGAQDTGPAFDAVPLRISTRRPAVGDTIFIAAPSRYERDDGSTHAMWVIATGQVLADTVLTPEFPWTNVRPFTLEKEMGGASGAPVLNHAGEVVGIFSGIFQRPNPPHDVQYGVFTPIDLVRFPRP